MSDTDFIRRSLLVLGGLLVWATHFALVYAFNTLACTPQLGSVGAFEAGIVPVVIAGATAAALIAVVGIVLRAWRLRARAPGTAGERRIDGFMRYTLTAIAALSFIAILWTGLPALLVSACG